MRISYLSCEPPPFGRRSLCCLIVSLQTLEKGESSDMHAIEAHIVGLSRRFRRRGAGGCILGSPAAPQQIPVRSIPADPQAQILIGQRLAERHSTLFRFETLFSIKP